jgi:hypothetical protein
LLSIIRVRFKLSSNDFQQGDIVWIVNDKSLNPSDPKYDRPYLILSKMQDGQYIICFITSKVRENQIRIEFRDLSWGRISYNPSFVPLDTKYLYVLHSQSHWDKRATLQENKIKEILGKFNELLTSSTPEILYQPRVVSSPSPVFERGKRKS